MTLGRTRRRPSLRVERSLQRDGYRLLAGMDEVGRGALAGPVSVGVVLIDASCRSAPVGVRDSKLLPAARREALVAPVRRWALASAVGHAGPDEIDRHGIIAALRLAGRRALSALGVRPDLVVLDGQHDWLSDPVSQGLLALLPGSAEPPEPGLPQVPSVPPVRTIVKADRSCSSVAAASILAKVERDSLLIHLANSYPQYGWEHNKGYAAPDHLAALATHGPSPLHRRSWRLPGLAVAGVPPHHDEPYLHDGFELDLGGGHAEEQEGWLAGRPHPARLGATQSAAMGDDGAVEVRGR